MLIVSPLVTRLRTSFEGSGLDSNAGCAPHFLASLGSMMTSLETRSTEVQISVKMKGPRKPNRLYRRPPRGCPRMSLEIYQYQSNRAS